MLLHQKKFELITHSASQKNHLLELPFQKEFSEYHTADGSVISPQPTVRDLGITITSDISWSTHITNIAEDARKITSWILFIGRPSRVCSNRSLEVYSFNIFLHFYITLSTFKGGVILEM